LPKGFYGFKISNNEKNKTSFLYYTTKGWRFATKHPQVWNDRGHPTVACHSPFAKNNALNVLYDRLSNQPVKGNEDVVEDLDERLLSDGRNRYECRCDSKDLRNNKMISLPEFPFVCLPDPCTREVYGATFPGWNGTECDCGSSSSSISWRNRDPNDPASPCVSMPRDQNQHIYRFVPCTDERSGHRNDTGFYCPSDETTYFKKTIFFTDSPLEVLKQLANP
jgi:hypothetical protein